MRKRILQERILPVALSLAMVLGSVSNAYADETAVTEPTEIETQAETEEPEALEEIPQEPEAASTEEVTEETPAGTAGTEPEEVAEEESAPAEEEQEDTSYYKVYGDEVNENCTLYINDSTEPSYVAAGSTVTIKVVPDEGYTDALVYGMDDEDEMVQFDMKDDHYEFTMPESDVCVEVILAETGQDFAMVSNPVFYASGYNIYTINRGSSFRFFGVSCMELYTSTGTLVYCCLPFANSPMNGAQVGFNYNDIDASSSENEQLMAKAFYYGYGGAGNILKSHSSTDAEGITHFAIAYIWMNLMGHSYGKSWDYCGDYSLSAEGKSYVMSFINNIKSLPKVQGRLYTALYYGPNTEAQDLAMGSFSPIPDDGYVKLTKESTMAYVTANNERYSLKDAEYTVYSDAACTKSAGTLTTDENGNTSALKVAPGTYYVKETRAPKGYMTDNQTYTVTVTAGNTENAPAVVKVSDVPGMDPIGLLLKKKDAVTGKDVRRVEH